MSATGAAWERTPWRATQRAAWEVLTVESEINVQRRETLGELYGPRALHAQVTHWSPGSPRKLLVTRGSASLTLTSQ